MANRSYLYACNVIPGTQDTPEKNLIGLSEYNYAIPLAFKILLTANSQACRSRIFKSEECIAIAGDFEAGLVQLTQFLHRITLKEAQTAIEETLEFLNKPENKANYFLLECAEIFYLNGDANSNRNRLLLKNIRTLNNSMERALLEINSPPTQKQQPASKESLRTLMQLGIENWSNFLYYDFSH